MQKFIKLILITFITAALISCSPASKFIPQDKTRGNSAGEKSEQNQPKKIEIIENNNPKNNNYNEMGRIMILMYHQFTERETNEWTRSFDNFKKDLQTLYDKGYRPINLRDYINGNIDIPAGFTPVVFTFDDGTSGQFNLVEKDGVFTANPKSAVGVMEEFSKTHPDFPLKGTFFINHTDFFHGSGTPAQRLKYLVDKGFEIGNHTINHVNLRKITSAEGIQKEIGGHANKTAELLPGYVVDEMALPLGITSPKFPQYVQKGVFEGKKYENKVILLVGSNPALSPIDKGLDLLKCPRIRSMGSKPVKDDMYYWLNYFDKNPSERFISDGNKDVFTIPKELKEKINDKIDKKFLLQP